MLAMEAASKMAEVCSQMQLGSKTFGAPVIIVETRFMKIRYIITKVIWYKRVKVRKDSIR